MLLCVRSSSLHWPQPVNWDALGGSLRKNEIPLREVASAAFRKQKELLAKAYLENSDPDKAVSAFGSLFVNGYQFSMEESNFVQFFKCCDIAAKRDPKELARLALPYLQESLDSKRRDYERHVLLRYNLGKLYKLTGEEDKGNHRFDRALKS